MEGDKEEEEGAAKTKLAVVDSQSATSIDNLHHRPFLFLLIWVIPIAKVRLRCRIPCKIPCNVPCNNPCNMH